MKRTPLRPVSANQSKGLSDAGHGGKMILLKRGSTH